MVVSQMRVKIASKRVDAVVFAYGCGLGGHFERCGWFLVGFFGELEVVDEAGMSY